MSTTAELAEYERREADAVDARLRAEVRAREEGADRQHQAEINRAACWALMDHAGCGIDTAEAVIAAIIRKQIPHVTIDY